MSQTLLQTIDKIDERATNLGEVFAGTTLGRVIDSQRDMMRSLIREGNMSIATMQAQQLEATCDYAEKVNNESKI